MSSIYDSVGIEPTYELAESIIKSTIYILKRDAEYLNVNPYIAEAIEHSLGHSGYRPLTEFAINNLNEPISSLHLVIKHFPDVLIKGDMHIYIKDSNKHLLIATDLLVMDYYLLLLSEYEDRVDKYQRQLKKQQDRLRNKVLFVILLPFIMVFFMLLVGD